MRCAWRSCSLNVGLVAWDFVLESPVLEVVMGLAVCASGLAVALGSELVTECVGGMAV